MGNQQSSVEGLPNEDSMTTLGQFVDPTGDELTVTVSRDVSILRQSQDDDEDEEEEPEEEGALTISSTSSASENMTSIYTSAEEESNPSDRMTKEPSFLETFPETTATTTMTSSSSSECYRLPMFRRKSDPFEVIDSSNDDPSSASANRNQGDSSSRSNTTTTTTNEMSCFPVMSPYKPYHNSNKKPFLPSRSSSLSFQTCKDGNLSDDEDDDDDEYNNDDDNNDGGASSSRRQRRRQRTLDGTTNHSTSRTRTTATPLQQTTTKAPSTILGCVDTPLVYNKKSNSWSNLMGLVGEDPNEQYGYTEEEQAMEDGDDPTPASDLRCPSKEYWIVTTAALPWMTGTAVNPLLRAAYLSQRNRQLLHTTGAAATSGGPTVTLVLPWLDEAEDRVALYGPDWKVATPERQEAYIRQWLSESAQLPLEASVEQNGIRIQWYPSRYHKSLSSIFAMGDLCELIPQNTENMICILEEPEHVNCYRAPGRESWRDKFPHVIGIVHTNYKAYAQNHYSGLLTGPIVGALMGLMVRAYCDKVIKLSPVLQSYAIYKEVVSNVHGIRQEFFTVPHPPQRSGSVPQKHIYFIGKLLWAKGLDKLMELEACYRKATGSYFGVDIYGSGPQEAEIQKSFLGKDFGFSKGGGVGGGVNGSFHASSSMSSSSDERKEEHDNTTTTSTSTGTAADNNAAQRYYWRRFRQPIPARFLGRRDHAEVGRCGQYQIFLNPSITEVLCTTTAEAVAMGFWVIVPKHSSNEFFLNFPNCLQYSNRREFVDILKHCQKHDPPGWGSGQDRSSDNWYGSLSWEAATDRLINTGYLSHRDAKRSQRLQPRDKSIQEWHYALGRGTGGDVLRKVLGGGPVADQSQYVSMGSTSLSPSGTTTPGTNRLSPFSEEGEELSPNPSSGGHVPVIRKADPESARATRMIQAMMDAIGDDSGIFLEDDDDCDDNGSVLAPIILEQSLN